MVCKCKELLKIPQGNDIPLLVTLLKGHPTKEDPKGETLEPFPVEISSDVDVRLVNRRAKRQPVEFVIGDGGRIRVDLKADELKAGMTYGIEVTGTLNGGKWDAFGDSMLKITYSTESSAQQISVQADPYEVTLWAGYVGDVVPRHLRDLEGYNALTQLLDAMGETLGKKADTKDVTNALKNISDRFREYVPTSDKGKAGGVASLDSLGKILAAQLNMPWRGNFEGGFQDSNVAPGIWGIDGRRIGPNPLHGEDAHGVMLVFPDRYKTTVFIIAPPRDSQYGTAPEIYARRWMPAAHSWTSWLTTADFVKKNEIPEEIVYVDALPEASKDTKGKIYVLLERNSDDEIVRVTHHVTVEYKEYWADGTGPIVFKWRQDKGVTYKISKSGSNIILTGSDGSTTQVIDENTTYGTMGQTEANTGTASTSRLITAKVLKAAIAKHTEDKATVDFVNSTVQTATAEFRGTYQSVEELQEVEADRNDYAYVMDSDAGGNTIYKRYKYAEGTGWQWEYDLNCSGFTAAEWQTIKSGITPEDVEKLRELPEKDTVMPLTRATDTLLNPNECLEPGIYENVEFPEIELDPLAELGDSIGAGTNSTNGTMLVGMEGSADGNRIVQQVIVKSSWSEAVSLMVPTGSYTHYSNFAAHIAVRSIRISKGGVWRKGTPDSVTLNPDGTSTVIPGTPDRYEEFNSTHFGEWVPMASFAHIKSLVEAIRANFALKSDTLDRYKVGEEVLIGEWVEGGVTYDLFRKVVSFGNLPNAGQKTVEHGIADKVKFTRVSGITSDGRPLPLVTHDPDKGIYLAVGGTYVTIQTGATDRSSLTADVTIEFTRAKK